MLKIASAMLLSVMCAAPACAAQASQDISVVWNKVRPLWEEGVQIVASGKNPDERSLAEKVTFRDSKFRRIVGECFEIMADSDLTEFLDARAKALKQIAEADKKLVELEKDFMFSPESHWNPFKKTQKSIQEEMGSLRAKKTALIAQMEKDREKVSSIIESRGIPVTREQMDGMLEAADGEDIARIMAVAENISAIQQRIEQGVRKDSPIDMLKTYTGIYMMCNKIYVYSIEKALDQIDGVYLKKLSEMRTSTQDILNDAKNMRKSVSAEEKKELDVNIDSNKRMLEAIDKYARYLGQQKKNLDALREKAEKKFRVSVNTFMTVRTGSELLNMMRTSSEDFSRIFSFKVPDVSLLYGETLRIEFEDISRRLKLD